jgi:hypothetical protein
MGFTDGGLVEPLILLLFLTGLLACAAWVTVGAVRLQSARRRRTAVPDRKISAAGNALEEVIADPFINKPTRDRAITAREALLELIKEKNQA